MAETPSPPPNCRTWQYTDTKGGLDKNLKLNPLAAVPTTKPEQILVQVIAVALNPIDYKPTEIALAGRVLIPKPATPGIDFAGVIVTPASGSSLQRGQLVFGVAGTSPLAGGALSEYTLVEKDNAVPIPEGVSPIDTSTIGVAGLTAYQSIVPHVKKGDQVFINGGSGGTGVFGIQIAKAVGCYVTTACSTANVELCESLGADHVVDYKKGSVAEALKATGYQFDHLIDNVGSDPELYWRCHEYTKKEALYVMVGGMPSLKTVVNRLKIACIPGFLGGGKRRFVGFFPKPKVEDLNQIGAWMKEGKVRPVIDSKFPFEQALEAFVRLKTGRARGKIVVDVASETYNN